MTTFGWKRKAGKNVSKAVTSQFQAATGDQVSGGDDDDAGSEAYWLRMAKYRKVVLLEDASTKSKRLKEEGSILASADRYWEAIMKWDEALQLIPDNDSILDMKAQALMILHEVFPAVQAAELAVQFNPTWWVAHQTLGRAQLGLGEIKLAIRSFSRAIHLNPCDADLWTEDLAWACSLLQEKHRRGTEDAAGRMAEGQRSGQGIDSGLEAPGEQQEEGAAPANDAPADDAPAVDAPADDAPADDAPAEATV